MSPSRLARFAVLSTGAAGLLLAGPASAGQDAPSPCTVSYTANNVHPGDTLVSGFSVACEADPTWEITSLDLTTDIAAARHNGGAQHCESTTVGITANQSCSLPGVRRFEAYVLTYSFVAHGNFFVCADDGTCDPNAQFTDSACLTDPGAPARIGSDADPVLSCTYRRVVTVVS